MKNMIFYKCSEKWSDIGPLVLRVVAGIIFAVHGYQKFSGGIENVAMFFVSLGIPFASFFAYVVTFVELFGGIALILGLLNHWVSKLLAINMLVAMYLVHYPKGFFISGGGVEFTLMLFAVSISLMITGPGRWSLDNILVKRFPSL